MEIQNCGVINFCGGCLIEEVEVLPAVSDAKCEKIYRVKNGGMFIATDGGWTKLAEEKDINFIGQNGIEVTTDKNDPTRTVVTVDGKQLVGEIDNVSQSVKVVSTGLDDVSEEVEKHANAINELSEKNIEQGDAIRALTGQLTTSTGTVPLSGFDGVLNTSKYGQVVTADFAGNTDKNFNKNTHTVVGHLPNDMLPLNEVATLVPAIYEEDNSKTIVRITIKKTGEIEVWPQDDALGEYSMLAFNVSWVASV